MMKILPQNNKPQAQDLNFRLRLDIQFDKQIKMEIPNIPNFYQTTNGLRYADKINGIGGIDMDFSIERTDGSEPSVAVITLWNITDDCFNQIANHANAFELYMAEGQNDWSLLFRGYPHFSSQKGAEGGNNTSRGFLNKDDAVGGENDIATTITLIDSLHSFESANISKSYQGDVSTKTIIKDCATAMGVSIGDELKEYPMVNNYVARGKVRTVLRELCADKIGCKHTVDNGVLHLFTGTSVKSYGFLFNANNSSKPESVQEDKINTFHFTTKIIPNIRSGQWCKCDFKTLNGTREIYKAKITGNNYGTVGITDIWVK